MLSVESERLPPKDVEPAKWLGPYLIKGIPPDPWGRAYQYKLTGDQYVIWSKGPDGVEGNADDIQTGNMSK